VIGWGNLSIQNGELKAELGYVDSNPPKGPSFQHELDAELERLRAFLGLKG
jgi:hypothetical protein